MRRKQYKLNWEKHPECKVEQCKEKGINLLVINEDRKKINDQLRCCVTEFINGKDQKNRQPEQTKLEVL